MKNLLVTLTIAALLGSCVSKTEYETVSQENSKLKSQLDSILNSTKPQKMSSLSASYDKSELCSELIDKAKGNIQGNYFIDPSDAARKIRNGINLRKSLFENRWMYEESDDILAYYFPLSQIQELLKKIEDHPRNSDITGIRVYLAARAGSIPDAIMIPVDKDNLDIVKVYYKLGETIPDIRTNEEEPVLNNSTPCPTVCP